MKKLLDLQHPFFRPMWRRVATFVFIMGWGGMEMFSGNSTWALLFWVLGIYCAREFFFGEPPREPEKKKDDA